jgi:dimethylargininase
MRAEAPAKKADQEQPESDVDRSPQRCPTPGPGGFIHAHGPALAHAAASADGPVLARDPVLARPFPFPENRIPRRRFPLIAITRKVGASLPDCEVTHIARKPIDVERAREQHAAYVSLLESCGLEVVVLPALDELPDSVFVEDPVHVLDEIAVALSPGAPSRRPEVEPLIEVIGEYRPIARIELPATIDGGDILRIGRTLFVGRSTRTNDAGIHALAAIVSEHGYSVRAVAMRDCLHLKSGCTAIGRRVLINPGWVDLDAFRENDPMPVPSAEPAAADVLLLPGRIVMPDSFPRTVGRLEAQGLSVLTVDVSEFQNAEAGVTCLSVIFDE